MRQEETKRRRKTEEYRNKLIKNKTTKNTHLIDNIKKW